VHQPAHLLADRLMPAGQTQTVGSVYAIAKDVPAGTRICCEGCSGWCQARAEAADQAHNAPGGAAGHGAPGAVGGHPWGCAEDATGYALLSIFQSIFRTGTLLAGNRRPAPGTSTYPPAAMMRAVAQRTARCRTASPCGSTSSSARLALPGRTLLRWSGDLAAERAAFGQGRVAHAPMHDHGLR
jgi:hypothetical protein